MIAYIKQLQRAAEADKQLNHLGWTEGKDGFILPDRIIKADGKVYPATLSGPVLSVTSGLIKAGTLERQVELLDFFNHPAFFQSQFLLLSSLASTLLWATQHAGCVVHATGDTAASKSTSLFAAASLWGHPKKFPLNGTRRGATELARIEHIALCANIPTMIDEFTKMHPEEVANLALGISQDGGRIQKTRTGQGIVVKHTGEKSTILLTTGNESLHEVLSRSNSGGGAGEAGSMRIIELLMRRSDVHTKAEADHFMWELCQNYGHIGEVVVAEIIKSRDSFKARVDKMSERIYSEAHGTQGERYWVDVPAPVMVLAEECRRMGLLPFDPDALRKWYIYEQLPHMRGTLSQEYSSPAVLLASYLDMIDGNMIVTRINRGVDGDYTHVVREPHGQLLAHYDTEEKLLYLSRIGWRNWCGRIGVNPTQSVRQLMETRDSSHRRLVVNDNYRKVLGAGTNWAKLQTACIVIDMSHAEVAGTAEAINDKIAKAERARPTVH